MGKSELVDTMVNDALWDATGCNMHMGMTAENVCTNETYQKKYGYSPITREMLDEFSYHSQEKAAKAIADGAFKDEIVPVVIKGKKGDTVFDTDEGPRMSSMEVLGKLKPTLHLDGKSAAYVNAAFDMAVSEMNERKDTNYQRSQMMHGDGKPPVKQTGSASEARQRMIDRRMKKEEK